VSADSGQIATLIALIAAALALVLAGVVLFLQLRLRRSITLLQVVEGRETMVDVIGRTLEDFQQLREDVIEIDRALTQTQRDLADSLRHVSVVRYDAFGDLGGRFSFSAALLDDSGDGLVLTSIHGRSETRTYVKGLTGGRSDIDLSPEERRAVQLARGEEP
jgi:hypothetical protein